MTTASVKPAAANVYVLDDDGDMRAAIIDVLRSYDFSSHGFGNAEDFLAAVPAQTAGCLVLDVRMPGIGGLELQEELAVRGHKMPIVFITGFGDIPMTVQAMKAGAVDFLTKPFDDDDLVRAVTSALQHDALRRQKDAAGDAVAEMARSLTRREWQVMEHVVSGLMNKQIAYELSLTEITVKLHRASLMRKLKSRTLPDLVRKAELLFLRSQQGNTTPPYSSRSIGEQLSPQ